MHEKISSVTILTIVISTILLVVLGSLMIAFLFAYQKKSHKHEQELLVLNETFNKTLLLSKLEIREQTLGHIAKELHANISHLISVININLSTHLQQHHHESNENIIETKTLVKQLMHEIKSLSVTLNTEHVGKIGFQQMLQNELDRLTKTGVYQVQFTKSGDPYRLQPEKEIILFRLCQEILNNIIKHAAAKKIDVIIIYGVQRISVKISDDGKGFNPQEAEYSAGNKGSTGLTNIYSRTRQINGEVRIISVKDQGTAIEVNIPS